MKENPKERLDQLLADENFRKVIALRKDGDAAKGAARLGKLSGIDLGDPDDLVLVGAAASTEGDGDLALEMFSKALELAPANLIHYSNLASVLEVRGRVDEALDYCRRGLAAAEGDAKAAFNIANIIGRRGLAAEAIAIHRDIIARTPDYANSHCALATLLLDAGELEESRDLFRRALALRPDFPEALNNFALLDARCGRYEEAEASFRKAIALEPGAAEFHSNLGDLLRKLGRFEESEQACAEALRLRPTSSSANLNMGNALREQSRFAAAEGYYEAALKARPNYPEAFNNLGSLMYDLGRLPESIKYLYSATALKPDYVDAHVNLAMALLLAGRFREGWPEYEWRWRQERNLHQMNRFSSRLWTGEPIGDRVLLLHAEQGIGDTLQFCRYAPYLAAGHRVVLEVQGSLCGLMRSLPHVEAVVAAGDPLPPHDLHAPLLNLPRIFGTVVQTIPTPGAYLRADGVRAAEWRKRLAAAGPGLKIGLAWAGNRSMGADRRRSIPADRLSVFRDLHGVSFVSLQKEKTDDIAGALPNIVDWTADLHDWSDTAALVDALDLVISVDTAVAHLAGALGRPVWLLNRFDRCWRWMADRPDSPWYRSLKQFRQVNPGDWTGVLQAVRSELLEMVHSTASQRREMSFGMGATSLAIAPLQSASQSVA